MHPGYFNLADNLVGHTIGRWTVNSKISHKPSSGGTFSVGYEVTDAQGYKGFLKALDYSSAFGNPRQADMLNHMTSAYIFERDLLGQCSDKRLKYVVRIIDYGQYTATPDQLPTGVPFCLPVDYLVLEMADNSVRSLIDLSKTFDYAWALRSLHNVAVGIEEMHGIQIAHQDIKPSNVLLFDSQHVSKLGDVGRSSSLAMPAEHDKFATAGDRSYSPFEQLYGEIQPDWKIRRFSCDMFMFGTISKVHCNFAGNDLLRCNMALCEDRMVPIDKNGDLTDILKNPQRQLFVCNGSDNRVMCRINFEGKRSILFAISHADRQIGLRQAIQFVCGA